MKEIKSIGVYCSASERVDGVYKTSALELGKQLARHNLTMVYGGGAQGLMGVVANSTMEAGGRVIGFMPDHLKEFEDPNWNITELHMVDTMHTRKKLMFEHSDAFFVLPGGFGTLDETFEIITWRQLQLHDKPVIFINVNGYWDPLEDLMSNIIEQNFAKKEHRQYFKFVTTIPDAFKALQTAPEQTSHEPLEWV